jgi:hypothetical protein
MSKENKPRPKAILCESCRPRNSALHLLIRNFPAVEPFEMRPLAAGPNHSEADSPEKPVQSNGDNVQDAEDTPLHLLVQSPCCPIEAEAHYHDREPKCRVVMMDIGNTTHSQEGKIVQCPSDDGIDTGVVDLVKVGLLQVVVTTLPAHGVPDDN